MQNYVTHYKTELSTNNKAAICFISQIMFFYYGKINLEISKIKHDLIFLKTCKTENLLSKFVQFKISTSYQQHQYVIKKCYRQILLN